MRGVWQRHSLLTKHERLLRLEKATAERKIELSDEQTGCWSASAPSSASATSRRRTPAPGRRRHLLRRHAQGRRQGLSADRDRLLSRYAWARLYTSKLPVTAVHLLNNDVLPTFEAHGARIETVLSDKAANSAAGPDQHPYELFLQLEEIEHRTTRVKRPQSNGIVERLHRTLLDEHFRVEGRRTWFETIDEMQAFSTRTWRATIAHRNTHLAM